MHEGILHLQPAIGGRLYRHYIRHYSSSDFAGQLMTERLASLTKLNFCLVSMDYAFLIAFSSVQTSTNHSEPRKAPGQPFEGNIMSGCVARLQVRGRYVS